jgi:TonB family protein
MTKRYRSLSIALIFFVITVPSTLAQTASPSDKKCPPPRVIYQADLPLEGKDTGTVVLSILVDEKGRVSDPKVTQSSGSERFDRDALKTVQRWKFAPPTCDGVVRSTRINVEMKSRVAR